MEESREAPVGLVARAQDGDSAAFEELLLRHFDAAFAVALGVTGRRAEAEDVCQDAFVRAWQRIGQCRDARRFRSWLLQVVRRVALNRIAAERRRRLVPLHPGLPADTVGPERAAARNELGRRLETALRRLSDRQREALLLYDLEGFRHAEVAELMGISELTSRRHVSDARARLRELLSDPLSGEKNESDG
ncbi:MAG: RNA polymerase sigma factor [Gemmatimonadales bacterium]